MWNTNQTAEYCDRCGGFVRGLIDMGIPRKCICHIVPIGWECPRCHKVHSPYSLVCDCPRMTVVSPTVLPIEMQKEEVK